MAWQGNLGAVPRIVALTVQLEQQGFGAKEDPNVADEVLDDPGEFLRLDGALRVAVADIAKGSVSRLSLIPI